jgi:hypothetical protein
VKNSNVKKARQLGMPHGTAQGRLVKMLLLRMAQDLGRDFCHRCGGRIESVKELSTDHKKEWLDADTALYWDLDNIAFSHRSCNYAAARRTTETFQASAKANGRARSKAVKAPPGTAWCYGHKKYLDKDLFNRNKWTVSGTQRFCKECRSKKIGR